MSLQKKTDADFKVDLNPYISGLASRLIKTAAKAEMPMDSQGWQLITEVLSYAASAEQRMAEQQERISFLERLAVTDELTNIPNRRGLKNALGRILAGAARYREGGLLAFIDLDSFKEINDRYGHTAGDTMLRHTAQFLRRMVRPQDVVARIGGDEFAIVLTRCSPAQTSKRIQIIQDRFNKTTIEFNGTKLQAKCSVGYSFYTAGTDPAELIKAADQAMYENKNKRRTSFD